MKQRWLIPLILIALALYWWLHRPQEAQNDNQPDTLVEAPQELGATPEAPALQVTPTPIAAAPKIQAEAPKAQFIVEKSEPAKKGTGRPKPPPGAVPYKMEGKFAVAYGDIILGEPENPDAPLTGFAKTPPLNPWDNVEIPYFISEKLANPDRIKRVIAYFNENTPVRFVPFAGQQDAVVFETADNHCRSYLGRIGGHQPVFIGPECTETAISHEIMHVLGFVHEQSRPDRDRYVKIHWERILPDKQDQFEIVPDELASHTQNRPFDYRSIMMYPPTAFARTPGEITLESIGDTPIEPVKTGLSNEDLERIVSVYGR